MGSSGWLQNIPAVAEKLAEAHRTAFLALSVPELCAVRATLRGARRRRRMQMRTFLTTLDASDLLFASTQFLLARTQQEYTGPAALPADLKVLAERAAATQVDLALFSAEVTTGSRVAV